jgi:hypothetical protein
MGDRRDKASGPRPFLTAANISNARKPLREVFRAGAVVALDTSCMYVSSYSLLPAMRRARSGFLARRALDTSCMYVSFLLFAARDAARA